MIDNGECTGVKYSLTGNKPIAQAALLVYNPPYLYDGTVRQSGRGAVVEQRDQ